MRRKRVAKEIIHILATDVFFCEFLSNKPFQFRPTIIMLAERHACNWLLEGGKMILERHAGDTNQLWWCKGPHIGNKFRSSSSKSEAFYAILNAVKVGAHWYSKNALVCTYNACTH